MVLLKYFLKIGSLYKFNSEYNYGIILSHKKINKNKNIKNIISDPSLNLSNKYNFFFFNQMGENKRKHYVDHLLGKPILYNYPMRLGSIGRKKIT